MAYIESAYYTPKRTAPKKTAPRISSQSHVPSNATGTNKTPQNWGQLSALWGRQPGGRAMPPPTRPSPQPPQRPGQPPSWMPQPPQRPEKPKQPLKTLRLTHEGDVRNNYWGQTAARYSAMEQLLNKRQYADDAKAGKFYNWEKSVFEGNVREEASKVYWDSLEDKIKNQPDSGLYILNPDSPFYDPELYMQLNQPEENYYWGNSGGSGGWSGWGGGWDGGWDYGDSGSSYNPYSSWYRQLINWRI